MFEVLTKNHPDTESVHAFVHERFRTAYGADIKSFMPQFVRASRKDGKTCAVMGYRDATSEPLYLEQYMDEKIEVAISRYLGQQVKRSEIVEVGNLAEVVAGDARMAIIGATAYFHEAGYRWVVFTGVTRLRNAFVRLGMSPKQLIEVDELRLPEDERKQWGSYYAGDPVVCFGSIQEGHDNLQELWSALRDTWAAAEMEGKKVAGTMHQK
ncbi:thermostable hemolysin [Mariprofundus micogutta]|uniref:Thermostable hemolysin n=1 Tax=Mariprofundus micogutta TaxID=1921010 RepID=A0A1L8CR61_9PROT|nr:thermostable hemolysin [Mariprofundus micogutta]GAV21354.1 thermostable hemolysin [Mariprofundus micogutta]